jgi:hypothetical protein
MTETPAKLPLGQRGLDRAQRGLDRAQRRGVFTVWLIIFIDLLGFGIVLPSLPYFVQIFEVPAWME